MLPVRRWSQFVTCLMLTVRLRSWWRREREGTTAWSATTAARMEDTRRNMLRDTLRDSPTPVSSVTKLSGQDNLDVTTQILTIKHKLFELDPVLESIPKDNTKLTKFCSRTRVGLRDHNKRCKKSPNVLMVDHWEYFDSVCIIFLFKIIISNERYQPHLPNCEPYLQSS